MIIPSKTRDCKKCKDKVLCEDCILLTKQVKEFEANLNELKRKAPKEKGQRLAYYIE